MTYKRKGYRSVEKMGDQVRVVEWINGELAKVEIESTKPEVRGIQFEKLAELPQRYKEGDLCYGAAGVFGGQAGLYIRDGNNWRKL